MGITVRYGAPGLLGQAAYEAGETAGRTERERLAEKIALDESRRDEDFARRLQLAEMGQEHALEKMERGSELDMDRDRLRAEREAEDFARRREAKSNITQRQRQRVSEAARVYNSLLRNRGDMTSDEWDYAVREWVGQYSDLPEETLSGLMESRPIPGVDEPEMPTMQMPDGTEFPMAITKDGVPDPHETVMDYEKLQIERMEAEAKLQEARLDARLDAVKNWDREYDRHVERIMKDLETVADRQGRPLRYEEKLRFARQRAENLMGPRPAVDDEPEGGMEAGGDTANIPAPSMVPDRAGADAAAGAAAVDLQNIDFGAAADQALDYAEGGGPEEFNAFMETFEQTFGPDAAEILVEEIRSRQ